MSTSVARDILSVVEKLRSILKPLVIARELYRDLRENTIRGQVTRHILAKIARNISLFENPPDISIIYLYPSDLEKDAVNMLLVFEPWRDIFYVAGLRFIPVGGTVKVYDLGLDTENIYRIQVVKRSGITWEDILNAYPDLYTLTSHYGEVFVKIPGEEVVGKRGEVTSATVSYTKSRIVPLLRQLVLL